jgi:Lysine methyltransferase
VENPIPLEFDPPFAIPFNRPLTILELGSGTGIVGSRIAAKFTEPGKDLLIVTDLPDVCPLLTANLGHQLQRDGIFVRPLTWGNLEHAVRIASELLSVDGRDPRRLTHVVCSDLVSDNFIVQYLFIADRCPLGQIYFPELFAPLLRTLIQLSSPPFISCSESGTPTHELLVLISYKIRSLVKESAFWSAFGLWFTFEPVLMRPAGEASDSSWKRLGSSDGPTFVFTAQRRPSSFSWSVPSTDQELMSGVGAWGTDSRKGDDTLETLQY